MKAAVRRKYGPPKTIIIEKLARPIPADKQVLVKVLATTVNRTDCANLTAKPFIMRFILGLFKPKVTVLGTDFAGEVSAVGAAVKSFAIGDKVFGFKDTGLQSQAEYMAVEEEQLYPIPEELNFSQAAASLEGAHYAYSFIQRAQPRPGQKIFINGATGAIGSALLQLLQPYAVEINVSCNTKNIPLIASLGANKIYDYHKEDFTQDKVVYDFVFDAVGKSTFGKCKPLLKKGGYYISSELGPNAENIFFALITKVTGSKKVFVPVPHPVPSSVPFIIAAIKNKAYTPVIDREYPLDQISEAYQYVIQGLKTGNVVIKIAPSS